jgi:hypothetical protein
MFIFAVGVYVLGFFEDMGAWVRDGPINFRGANTKKKNLWYLSTIASSTITPPENADRRGWNPWRRPHNTNRKYFGAVQTSRFALSSRAAMVGTRSVDL